MSHNYDYYPCSNCGQLVAHTKSGTPLHMHRESAKCERMGKILRATKVEVDRRTGYRLPKR